MKWHENKFAGMGNNKHANFANFLLGFFAIEAKAKGKREQTTANQRIRIEEIHNAEGWALVVDDVQQLKEFINEQRR